MMGWSHGQSHSHPAELHICRSHLLANLFICSLKSYQTCKLLSGEFSLDFPIPSVTSVGSFSLGHPSLGPIKIPLMPKPQEVTGNGETTFS